MHYRRLGHSGLKVSEISLGSWVTFGNQVDEKTALELVHVAYDKGVNFFDCADAYADGKAEIVLGKALHDLPRGSVVVTSKVFFPTMPGPNGRGLSRKHIVDSIHASLRRFNLEYLDIYYCHRYDTDTPLEEVVRAMDDLIHQGYILYWGTSEWNAAQIAQAYAVARQFGLVPPIVEQPQYNLFRRKRVEDELSPLCKEVGLGLTTFSPLYSGILSGKYNDGIPESSRASRADVAWLREEITPRCIAVTRELTTLARKLDLTTAQLAIAWILRRKEVSCIITGASHPEQLDENLLAANAVDLLTNEVLESIDSIVEGISE